MAKCKVIRISRSKTNPDIFIVTGGFKRFGKIETQSKARALEVAQARVRLVAKKENCVKLVIEK